MKDKVDVLAVMNYASEVLDELGFTGRSSALDKARAAVNELIEVASEFDGYVAADNNDTSLGDREDMWDRLSAALARVKGE